METYLRTPIRYPGGKNFMVKDLVKYLPDHFDYYREPFLGGGSMFFYVKHHYPDAICWLNDINPGLIKFYEALSNYNDCTDLMAQATMIKKHFSFEEVKRFIEGTKDLALKFYLANRCTYNGLLGCGGYSEQAFNYRFTLEHITKLIHYVKVLEPAAIDCGYFDRAFYEPPSYNLLDSRKSVFVYADPPYYGVEGLYEHGRYGDFNHGLLADHIRSTDHQVMLSYNDVPEVRVMYKWAKIRKVNTKYSGNKKKPAVELIITNYE